MNIKSLVSGFKFKSYKSLLAKSRLGKVDLGVLKVALMVAALDGDVTGPEYVAFEAMAKKCRGYTKKAADAALKEAMHSAGYLMLLSKRVKTAELVKEFVAEAKLALPDGFAYYSIEDVRRAIVTWIAVGMSDGEYSTRERACIEALRKEFAELVVKRDDEDNERWAALSPSFRQAYGGVEKMHLVQKAFVVRVEELAAKLGDAKSAAEALQSLIFE